MHKLGVRAFWAIGTLLFSLVMASCLLPQGRLSSALVYTFVPSRITVQVGETIPGTDIRYSHMDENGAHVTIDGQPALKRQGDSLNWSGEPRPGVKVDLRLRVVWISDAQIELLGTTKVTVQDAQPRRAAIVTSSPMEYGGAVAYNVRKGNTIPGTLLTYEGETEEGARLGNVDGYPFRRAGDSIFWEGMLVDDVYVRLDLRAVQYGERSLSVGGWATLWIGQ
jgi:hypothetical protein